MLFFSDKLQYNFFKSPPKRLVWILIEAELNLLFNLARIGILTIAVLSFHFISSFLIVLSGHELELCNFLYVGSLFLKFIPRFLIVCATIAIIFLSYYVF